MQFFGQSDYDNHEKVVFINNKASGLKAIIAIHNTALGPALGGCRMYPYANENAALTDALRLSRGMTEKNAMVKLHWGGGKAIICLLDCDVQDIDPGSTLGDVEQATASRKELFEKYGDFIESLQGSYVTAEDMNTTPQDMDIIAHDIKDNHIATQSIQMANKNVHHQTKRLDNQIQGFDIT